MLKQFIDRVWAGGAGDTEVYAIVAQELASGAIDAGLWTKACAASGGATDKAKARYIEMRVREICGARKAVQRQALNAQRRIHSENALREKNQNLAIQEQAILQEIYEKHESPGAIKARNRRIVAITIFCLLLAYGFAASVWGFSTADGAPGLGVETAIIFPCSIAVAVFLAQHGTTSITVLRARLDKVRRQQR